MERKREVEGEIERVRERGECARVPSTSAPGLLPKMSCTLGGRQTMRRNDDGPLPDVRDEGRDVVLCSRVEIFFRSLNRWSYALVA